VPHALVAVSSTAKWPQSGYVKITTAACSSGYEYLGYSLVDSTHIQITSRAVDGFAACAHSIGDAIIPSAPVVTAAVPSVHKIVGSGSSATNATIVVVSASAGAGATGTSVQFINDPILPSSSCSNDATLNPCGYVILNTNYRTWTANAAAGATPDGMLTVGASSPKGTATETLTLASPYAYKLQEGMAVTDITNLGNIPAGAYVSATPSPTFPNKVQITAPTAPNSFGSDQLQFSGCGWPGRITGTSPTPWLGNCTATGFLFYGADGEPGATGTACDWLHGHGWHVYVHMHNGQETVIGAWGFFRRDCKSRGVGAKFSGK
jgi:hypothetical protein